MTEAAATFEMGIDEAGYGPLLGPLAVGVVRVDGPLGALGRALTSGRPGLPRIGDSKVLLRGRHGRAALEVAALAARTLATGALPRSVAGVLGDAPDGLADHPWYGALARAVPCHATAAAITHAAEALRTALAAEGAVIAEARTVVRLEGSLNADWARRENKAAVHLDDIARAVGRVWPPGVGGRVNCDRLGGRRDYAAFLRALCAPVGCERLSESADASTYRTGSTEWRFLVGGEQRSPEIALASCLAKHARELLMAELNAHFAAEYPGLRKTAGYVTDGRRFLAELGARADGWAARLTRQR